MENNRFLVIILIILSIFVFWDISRRIQMYMNNNTISISGTNQGIRIFSHRRLNQQAENIPIPENYNDMDFSDNSTGSSNYNKYMYRIMMHNWKNPLNNEDVHAEIQAIINRNGKITSYQLTKSSNYPEYDQAATNALLETSPFLPFPEDMLGNERLFTFYFNGSRAGANGFTYRNNRRAPLDISINQSSMRTNHPRIQDIKRARLECDTGYCYCNVWDMWRPSLTETSRLKINFTINKDLTTSIKNVEKINDTNATERAIEAVKNTKCENYPNKYPLDITYTFIVE